MSPMKFQDGGQKMSGKLPPVTRGSEASSGDGSSGDKGHLKNPRGGRFLYAVQVHGTSQLVLIVEKRYEGGRQILEAEDGRLFTPHPHSISVVEVT